MQPRSHIQARALLTIRRVSTTPPAPSPAAPQSTQRRAHMGYSQSIIYGRDYSSRESTLFQVKTAASHNSNSKHRARVPLARLRNIPTSYVRDGTGHERFGIVIAGGTMVSSLLSRRRGCHPTNSSALARFRRFDHDTSLLACSRSVPTS